MDLGIAGRKALVCAASKGLGRGCAEALAREGCEVTICARTGADVERTAQEIGDTLVAKFIQPEDEGGVNEIHIVYNRFVSMLTQEPEMVRLLPLEIVEGVEDPGDTEVFPLYEFEPEADTVLDALLPVYIDSRIFNALLQSAASKHAATQKAMKSASDNADTLIRDYTRLANNARQAEITQQISEIVGGADALSSAK